MQYKIILNIVFIDNYFCSQLKECKNLQNYTNLNKHLFYYFVKVLVAGYLCVIFTLDSCATNCLSHSHSVLCSIITMFSINNTCFMYIYVLLIIDNNDFLRDIFIINVHNLAVEGLVSVGDTSFKLFQM